MANTPSGRFSRFPAVNRDVVAVIAEEGDVEGLDDLDDSFFDISEMSARQVLAWVGDDELRREFARHAEEEGRRRKGLLADLG